MGDQFFASTFASDFPSATRSGSRARARTAETDDAFRLLVEMPGVPQENIDVTVDDGLLKISGEQQTVGWDHHDTSPQSASGDSARESGSNSRKVSFAYQYQLPRKGIDSANIHAQLNNGLLEVSVPKVAPPLPRSIPVNLSAPRPINNDTVAQAAADTTGNTVVSESG